MRAGGQKGTRMVDDAAKTLRLYQDFLALSISIASGGTAKNGPHFQGSNFQGNLRLRCRAIKQARFLKAGLAAVALPTLGGALPVAVAHRAVVWNDFWDSTENYNVEPDHSASFPASARDVILGFGNHPSIVLWRRRNGRLAGARRDVELGVPFHAHNRCVPGMSSRSRINGRSATLSASSPHSPRRLREESAVAEPR
jgi:hypothetical protein